MRRKLILFITICGISLNSIAQQVPLKGIVTVQNSKTKTGQTQYVKNAEVEHTNDKNAKTQCVTGTDGKFALNIRGVAQNSQIQLSVHLYGDYADYAVVNEKEIKDITLGRVTPVSVYVCKKGELEDRQAEMVNINIKKIKEPLEKEKKRLQKELEDLESENDYLNVRYSQIKDSLDIISKNIENAFGRIKEYAQIMVLENLDDRDSNYVKAYNCFSKGDLDSVSYYLSDHDLDLKHQRVLQLQKEAKQEKELAAILTESAKQKEEFSQNSLNELLKEWLLLARTCNMKNDYEKAKEYYEKVINADTTNAKNMFEFANFLYKMKEYPNSEKLYLQCLEIYQTLGKDNPKAYLPDIGATLNNLANLYLEIKEYSKALEEHEKALAIRRKLAEETAAFLPDVAMSLNNLAVLHKTTNQNTKALKEYEESLKIRRELVAENSQYLPNIATTLSNLGNLHLKMKEYTKAFQESEESLEIYRKLDKENPKTYSPDLALILSNLAVLHNETNQYPKALEKFEEALKTYRQLAEENPKAYLSNVVTILNNLSNTYGQMKDYPAAIKQTNACIEYQKQMNHKQTLAENYGDISWYHLFTKEYVPSEQSARQALELDSTSLVAKSNLAHALLFQNRFLEAEKIYKELSQTIDNDHQPYSQALLEDFDTLEEESAIPEERKNDVEKIREMLK